MTTLTPREVDQLTTYLKKCKRTTDWFVFGPSARKDFDGLKPILDKLNIGYFGSFEEEKGLKKGELPDKVYINVTHRQAHKLSQVLISLHNKEELEFMKAQKADQEPEEVPVALPTEAVQPEPTKPKNRWKPLVKSKGES